MSRISLDTEAIRALAALLHETGLSEIEIAEKDSRIRVARNVTAEVTAAPVRREVPVAEAVSASPVAEPVHPGAVTSPMVGVAYLASEPGAPPFVAVGQNVAAGQTLLLIEAMKTFNQIKAPKSGTVTRILIASGMPVEYGEILMVLE